jgi:AcrR family transcriptional regulator
MNTREKILDKALEMFNERGIEYVGLRELAGILEMRVSNITYYFPTKDDLVYELSQELSRKNSAIMVEDKNMTMNDFLQMLRQVFENHYQFRGLLRSFVHVMTQNKLVLSAYKKIQDNRKSTIASNFHALAGSGYLKIENEEQLNFLVSTISMISRYWISEAAMFAMHLSREQQIRQYFLMIINLLWPYATAKSKKEITSFREQLVVNGDFLNHNDTKARSSTKS